MFDRKRPRTFGACEIIHASHSGAETTKSTQPGNGTCPTAVGDGRSRTRPHSRRRSRAPTIQYSTKSFATKSPGTMPTGHIGHQHLWRRGTVTTQFTPTSKQPGRRETYI